jgi:phospholipid-binding lipoprotein MlaA
MMKRIGLLIIFVFCLALHPCLSSAQETDDATALSIQAEEQQQTDAPPPAEGAPAEAQQPAEAQPATDQTNSDQVTSGETTAGDQSTEESEEPPEEPWEFAETNINHGVIADPLEPMNRAFFVFNDKLYFWFYKPVASVYIVIAPEPVRIGIKNFFNNIFFPVRFVNSLFQAKFKGAGNEVGRFLINSTIGLAGFIDVADKKFGIKESDEDFGQTLAFYGVGQGFYIDWPFLGPSSTVDTVGLAGDIVLDPTFYFLDLTQGVEEKSIKTFNERSLAIDDYENLKDSALDPYVAIRDAYIQYRKNKVKN